MTTAGLRQNLRAISGNRVIITLRDQRVGYIQNLQATDDYAPEPLTGLGDIHVQEWVPTVARYTLSCDRAIIRWSSLMTLAAGLSEDAASGTTAGNLPGSGAPGSGDTPGVWEDGYQVMKGFVFDIEATDGVFAYPSTGDQDTSADNLPGQNNQQITVDSQLWLKKWYDCSFASGNIQFRANTIVVENATFNARKVSGKHRVIKSAPSAGTA